MINIDFVRGNEDVTTRFKSAGKLHNIQIIECRYNASNKLLEDFDLNKSFDDLVKEFKLAQEKYGFYTYNLYDAILVLGDYKKISIKDLYDVMLKKYYNNNILSILNYVDLSKSDTKEEDEEFFIKKIEEYKNNSKEVQYFVYSDKESRRLYEDYLFSCSRFEPYKYLNAVYWKSYMVDVNDDFFERLYNMKDKILKKKKEVSKLVHLLTKKQVKDKFKNKPMFNEFVDELKNFSSVYIDEFKSCLDSKEKFSKFLDEKDFDDKSDYDHACFVIDSWKFNEIVGNELIHCLLLPKDDSQSFKAIAYKLLVSSDYSKTISLSNLAYRDKERIFTALCKFINEIEYLKIPFFKRIYNSQPKFYVDLFNFMTKNINLLPNKKVIINKVILSNKL